MSLAPVRFYRDLGEYLLVKPVEHDDNNSNSRRETQEPLLRETIRFDLAILERSHSILLVLIAAVERRQIEIRRGIGDVEILVIGSEQV